MSTFAESLPVSWSADLLPTRFSTVSCDVVALAAAAVVGDPVDRDEHGRGAAGVGDRVGAVVAVHAVGPAATVDRVVAVGIAGRSHRRPGSVSAPLPPLRSSAPAPPSIVVGSDVFASTESLLLCISNESVFSGTPVRDLGRAGDLDRRDRVAEVRPRADRRAAGLGVEELAARELLGDDVPLPVGEPRVDEVHGALAAAEVEKRRRCRGGEDAEHQPGDRDGQRNPPTTYLAAAVGRCGAGRSVPWSEGGIHAWVSLLGRRTVLHRSKSARAPTPAQPHGLTMQVNG